MLASLAAMLLCSGCKSAHEPGGTSHVVEQIDGHTLAEIQEAASAVFGEEGYTLATRTPTLMVFDRPGSRRDAAKYGGWMGEGVTMRVRVAFTELAGDSYRLQADAYAVQNGSDPFFQDENRVLLLNRAPYRRMLNDVASRLK
jgi:hypothetical protein